MAYPSNPRHLFGVHSFSPYSRTDATFYGIVKCLQGASINSTGTLVPLMGGSSKYAWASEESEIKTELNLKLKEYPDFLFQLFLGKAPTATAAETTGNVSTLTNYKGTSVMSATTGIASATAKASSEADIKFGKYVVVAASSTTVDVYFSSDADMGRGTNGSYLSDTLKIASALTITSAATTDISNFGIKFTGGSGTIGLTAGDSATFYARPIAAAGGMTVVIGGLADQTFPEFGAICMSMKRGSGEMFEVDLYRCKSAGMPLDMSMGAWSGADVKVDVLYDPSLDGVMQIRHTKPSGV